VSRRQLITSVLAAVAGLAPLTCGGGGDSDGMTACGTADAGNHDLRHAVAFGVGNDAAGCVGPDGHPDVYSFSLEDGAQAGYLTFQLAGDALGSPTVALFGDDGEAPIATVAAAPDDTGAPMAFSVAVSPGVAYRLTIADDGAAASPYSYSLGAAFTPVPDSYEPNDRLEEAAPIMAGAPIAAYLFTGAGTDLAAYDDHYRVTLAAGQPVTVHLDDVPADIAPRIFIYDPSGVELGRVVNGHKGAAFTLALPSIAVDGDYTVKVGLWTETPATMGPASALPDHFTHPYRLTVTQP
jgi:hypothetical protein